MPSHADLRRRIEWILRAIVIGSLALMLWRSFLSAPAASERVIESSTVNAATLAIWSRQSQAPRIHLNLDAAPSRVGRAWLAALARAGSAVRWSGRPVPIMTAVEPIAQPTGGARVLIAAPPQSSVVLADDVGPIDSLKPASYGASITLGAAPTHVAATAVGTTASAGKPDSVLLRRILVVGSASWETKFVTAALEEAGWKVDAMIRVAPGVDVGPASLPAVDTSRYSAVVAVDSAAAPYANRISQFVRDGGGIVLASDAANIDGFAPLRAGLLTSPNESGTANIGITLATLSVHPFTSLRPDAVPLQRTRGVVSLAARRVAGGRVVQLGLADTWRLRMSGGDDGVREHRQLWKHLVSSVAYAPRIRTKRADVDADPAPLADLIAALGESTPISAEENVAGGATDWMLWLFVLFAAALIGEVASRRLRGAP